MPSLLCRYPEGRFSKLGLDLELDDDFQVDVGVEIDGLALPGVEGILGKSAMLNLLIP